MNIKPVKVQFKQTRATFIPGRGIQPTSIPPSVRMKLLALVHKQEWGVSGLRETKDSSVQEQEN